MDELGDDPFVFCKNVVPVKAPPEFGHELADVLAAGATLKLGPDLSKNIVLYVVENPLETPLDVVSWRAAGPSY